MIRAVIFDCFGVLTTDLWLDFKQKHFGGKPVLEQEATKLNQQTDLGLISYDDFIERVAKLAGISSAETHLHIEANVSNQELFHYIQHELKPQYKVGLLSNAATNWLEEIFTSEQVKLFDAVVLSYATKFIKPQPEIYQLIVRQLDVLPDECVFVDDREGYCVAARELGMQAICYKDFAQFRAELGKILEEGE